MTALPRIAKRRSAQVEVIVAKVVLDLSRFRSEKQIEHDYQTEVR
jgi:hypothetical protein